MIPQQDLTSYGSNGNTGHAVPSKTAAKVTRDKLLTPEEVAALFQVCAETVLRWARQKKLKGIKISKKVVRFSVEEVKRFINSHEEAETTSCDNGKKRGKIESRSSKVVARGGRCESSRKSLGNLREEVALWR
jgi:excisionase family DNA binding protein